jgi:hypothetical protein
VRLDQLANHVELESQATFEIHRVGRLHERIEDIAQGGPQSDAVSDTVITTDDAATATDSLIAPPWGVYFDALSNRLLSTWPSRVAVDQSARGQLDTQMLPEVSPRPRGTCRTQG